MYCFDRVLTVMYISINLFLFMCAAPHVETLSGLCNICRNELIIAKSCCDQAQQSKSIMQCNLGNGDEWS